MSVMTEVTRRNRPVVWLRTWPYWPVVSHSVVRRLLPGYGLSALGDGMSAVAIAWLALRLAPPATQALWVGAAVAAYSVPGVLGAALLGRWLRHRAGVRLAGADAALRAVALGTIPLLSAAHELGPASYVSLLGVSSLLHAWGTAGQYTLVAEVLPPRHRVAGNALLGTLAELSFVAGPALAGVLTAAVGPALVIGGDAVTWAVLAVSYARIAPMITATQPVPATQAAPVVPAVPAVPDASATPTVPASEPGGRSGEPARVSSLRLIGANRTLLGLAALSFMFFLLYGPVEVALPVHIATDLHGSATLLGGFWAVYGVAAVIGSLAAPYLRYWPLWPTMIGIVAGWGLALLPLGLGAPTAVGMAGFALGGVIYAPYNSIAIAVFQDHAPDGMLAQLLAARAGLMIVSTPIGIALGGPLVAAFGARITLLVSALATIALAVLATLARATRRAPATPDRS